jgi:hypothetical protein
VWIFAPFFCSTNIANGAETSPTTVGPRAEVTHLSQHMKTSTPTAWTTDRRKMLKFRPIWSATLVVSVLSRDVISPLFEMSKNAISCRSCANANYYNKKMTSAATIKPFVPLYPYWLRARRGDALQCFRAKKCRSKVCMAVNRTFKSAVD